MHTLFPSYSPIPAANVASVPQRSPLRYPGGKTWLIPHIRHWLRRTEPTHLVEPFAGGGTASLTAVMEDLVHTALMIEIDPDVAAFWRGALCDGARLRYLIAYFPATADALRAVEAGKPTDTAARAFRTLVLNRFRRGGVLAPAAGTMRAGEDGRGLSSRWYRGTLIQRLKAIEDHAYRLPFTQANAMHVLPDLLACGGSKTAFFIDPPYTISQDRSIGARLYKYHRLNHGKLFAILSEWPDCPFLMTYNACGMVISMVRKHGFHAVAVSMKTGAHVARTELIVTRRPLFDSSARAAR